MNARIIVIVAALIAWNITAPAAGSGWFVFVAFVAALGMFSFAHEQKASKLANAFAAITAACFWFCHQDLPDSGFVLFVAAICLVRMFCDFGFDVSIDRSSKQSGIEVSIETSYRKKSKNS